MLRVLILFSLFSSLLFSREAEEFPFAGLAVSSQSVDIHTQKSNDTILSLRYGRQTLDWRTILSYQFGDSYKSLSVEFDKILLDELFGTPKVRPYLGLSVGTLKYKDDSLEDTSGYYYGANAGFIFYLTDRIDADLGYYYNIVQEIESLDTIRGITLSLHYFF